MWFELTGDARLGRCASHECGGQPTWRLEAGGVASNYCSGCRAQIDDQCFDESEYADESDETDWLEMECGLMANGQCGMAGTEHCDFSCPNRDSEDFAGSEAWNEKHKMREILGEALAKNEKGRSR